jgi:hypothetical protein
MPPESNAEESKRIIQVLKHLAAWMVTAYPVAVMILAGLLNPASISRLWMPDSETKFFGWVILGVILLSLGGSYALALLIADMIVKLIRDPASPAKRAAGVLTVILLGIGLYLLLTLALVCILAGPAGLTLMKSPVGTGFFGG